MNVEEFREVCIAKAGVTEEFPFNESALTFKVMGKMFAITYRGAIGPAEDDDQSIMVLNQIVTWAREGIEMEADQRHAELIIKTLGVEGAKTLSTPGWSSTM